MECYKIKNLSFRYPQGKKKALDHVNLEISSGEFITLCGKSGCGKTTLLRLLKPTLAPHGEIEGEIRFNDATLLDIKPCEEAAKIGFIMQNPDNQIVTDKVWHELAFGLESLGMPTGEIRVRVSEMASFFGIQTWFHKNVTELSGGQKQLLNLASVMVMQPSVIILDEPTSQLDPIAAEEFLKTLEKINKELGVTVVLSEHRLEEAFPISDRVVVMDEGKIIACATPREVCKILTESEHHMFMALPTPARIYGSVENDALCPLNVREGRAWLEKFSAGKELNCESIQKRSERQLSGEKAIEISDVWFRYEKNQPDVLRGLSVEIKKGEFFAILGGNGTGKTTALSIISGINTAYRGEVLIYGKKLEKHKNLYNGVLGVLPQNPQTLFVKKTVYLDLLEICENKKYSKEEAERKINFVASMCLIEELLESHPYDLSGGEQQRAALAKVLLSEPQILLLDEPTKGLDAYFKSVFADIIENLLQSGVTVVMVSHDVEFCAQYADRCAMFFDGQVASTGKAREFFAGKNFYTTSANRMARNILPGAVLAEDVISALGGRIKKREKTDFSFQDEQWKIKNKEKEQKEEKTFSLGNLLSGAFFLILFVLTYLCYEKKILPVVTLDKDLFSLIAVIEFVGALICLLPKKNVGMKVIYQPRKGRKLDKRTTVAAILILLLIPLTIYAGVRFFDNRKYYFISLLIIFQTMIPFAMVFENRKPKARELVIISTLCAIAVAGRAAFFMLPQFKPVVALVILSGICFGGESGFLVGAVTGFVSNFFLGQGPWTPWQMFSFGIIGFLSGILFRKGLFPKTRTTLCVFGFLSTLVIYGGIMNPASVIMSQEIITGEMLIASYATGLPLDIIHSLSTAFFLWVLAEPMVDKLERIKMKYGLIE